MKVKYKQTRISAKNAGHKYYFTGKVCRNGHTSSRLVSTNVCRECAKINEKKRYNKFRAKMLARSKKTEGKLTATDKTNRMRLWRKNNRNKWLADRNKQSINRRLKSSLAIPGWCEQEKIKKLYKKCRTLTKKSGIEYNVDHIIPLIHERVCGLHCYDNLQIITASANRKKKNTLVI